MRQVGGRDVLDPAQRILAVSRNPALVKHDRPVAIGGGRDHPEREALLADVLAQLVEIHQPCKRPRQRFGVQDRRAVHAAHRQKLADVAHKPSRAADRHQRRAHVPESQIAPEPQPVLDRLLGRTMPISHQIRRDQRARARPDDHPHLILKLGQQHRQRPGCVGATRPAATQHQTHLAACTSLAAHDLIPSRSPAQPRHAAMPVRAATQTEDAATTPAPSTSRGGRSITDDPVS